jgi:hypothetical protein
MVAQIITRRSDAQLELILYETANWTVNGPRGLVLVEVASLRLALETAAALAARRQTVAALLRGHPTGIIVFSGQMRALMVRLAQREGRPLYNENLMHQYAFRVGGHLLGWRRSRPCTRQMEIPRGLGDRVHETPSRDRLPTEYFPRLDGT